MAKNESYYSGEKYNLLAKKQGYRSRAAFKLVQIDKEENILKKNLNIIDPVSYTHLTLPTSDLV